MGLNGWLAARAVRASRALIVECPGAWRSRVAAERAVAQRGWRLAESPATADLLVVVGRPGDELAEVVGRLWDAMPGPRTRVDLAADGAICGALDEAVAHLGDARAQAEDAASRAGAGRPAEAVDPGHEAMDHGSMDHSDDGSMDHGDDESMDHGDDESMDHESMDHGGMDHGDMDMAPGGIPLAEGSEDDRDGLEMDALPVRLGPALPNWPAGLVLDVTLHGDLVTDASARLVDSGDAAPPGGDGPVAARACDDVGTLLDLAGWPDGAARARAVRDDLLAGRDDRSAVALADLRRRVAASRLLRWSLRGVGVVHADHARELGLPDHLAGDCLDRLLALLDRAETGATASVPAPAVGPLVVGYDLAVARLVVASLGALVATSEVGADA